MKKTFQHLDIVSLNDQKSTIEVLRVGKVHDRDLTITEAMLDDFIKNFEANVYGTEIQVNLGHQRDGEAAGWVKRLIKDGGRLFAEVEWTPLGVEKISSKQFRFTSSELSLSWPHFKTGKPVKNVFIGVALTNVPAIKGMEAVSLSEDLQIFFNLNDSMKLKKLYAKLSAKKTLTKAEVKEFEEAVKGLEGDDITSMKAAIASKKVKELSEENADENEGDEDKDGGEGEEENKGEGKENLSESIQLKEMRKSNLELSQKVMKMELNEKFDKELTLSETNKVGFLAAKKDSVVAFMLSLSTKQLKAFGELIKDVKTVDLSSVGVSKKKEVSKEETKLSELEKKAAELALSDKTKSESEHLSDLIVESGIENELE